MFIRGVSRLVLGHTNPFKIFYSSFSTPCISRVWEKVEYERDTLSHSLLSVYRTPLRTFLHVAFMHVCDRPRSYKKTNICTRAVKLRLMLETIATGIAMCAAIVRGYRITFMKCTYVSKPRDRQKCKMNKVDFSFIINSPSEKEAYLHPTKLARENRWLHHVSLYERVTFN